MLNGFGAVAQPRWSAWRAKQKLEREAPEDIDDLVASLVEFTDPILDGSAAALVWNASASAWQAVHG